MTPLDPRELPEAVMAELHKLDGRAVMASVKLGKWMSAALDDPSVCEEMKADIYEWFAAGEPVQRLVQALLHHRAAHEAPLKARIAELEAENARLRGRTVGLLLDNARLRTLAQHASNQFRFYQNAHAAKGTPDGDAKAETNREWADRLLSAALKGQTDDQ